MGDMRLLFDMDLKDYDDCTHTFVRNSARSIIIRDGKIAMIHSKELTITSSQEAALRVRKIRWRP